MVSTDIDKINIEVIIETSVDILGFQHSDTVVTIYDSYMIPERDMGNILYEFKKTTGYNSKRSIKSWVREWKAHNRLYKLGLFRSHTKDCDLEEHEAWWKLLIYNIIGR